MSLDPPDLPTPGAAPTSGVGTLPPGDSGRGSGTGGPRGPGGTGPRHRRSHGRRWVIEWAAIVVVAVVVAIVVRAFIAQTFYVPSTSMYPTLKAGDRIVVNKLSFDLHSIDRGDIVVFRRPPREAQACGGQLVPDLVKRVIGLPDETISARDGQVYITGKRLAEPWLPKTASTYTANFGPVHIPAGQYFMMGDNRTASCDSRMWGTVPKSYIVGKVDLIIWPLSQFHFF